jgi:hypothetical protein
MSSSNAIKDGWKRFLDRLKQLWGRPRGGEFAKAVLIPVAPVSRR